MTLTYVYCLVRSARRPSLRGVAQRMPDSGPVRALDAGRHLWLIVSDVSASGYDETALASGLQDLDWVGERAMAHEAVVEQFLTATAVLPLKLFTLFTSDERALTFVARDRAAIDRILARVTRHLEWGLRLSLGERPAPDAAGGASARTSSASGRASTGASYLARKRDQLTASRTQLATARNQADRLYRALRREATESRRRASTEQGAPGSRLVLDAAFLVPARRTAGFRKALRRQVRALGAHGLVASLTGPWPPYNFIDRPSRAAARATRTTTRRPPRSADNSR